MEKQFTVEHHLNGLDTLVVATEYDHVQKVIAIDSLTINAEGVVLGKSESIRHTTFGKIPASECDVNFDEYLQTKRSIEKTKLFGKVPLSHHFDIVNNVIMRTLPPAFGFVGHVSSNGVLVPRYRKPSFGLFNPISLDKFKYHLAHNKATKECVDCINDLRIKESLISVSAVPTSLDIARSLLAEYKGKLTLKHLAIYNTDMFYIGMSDICPNPMLVHYCGSCWLLINTHNKTVMRYDNLPSLLNVAKGYRFNVVETRSVFEDICRLIQTDDIVKCNFGRSFTDSIVDLPVGGAVFGYRDQGSRMIIVMKIYDAWIVCHVKDGKTFSYIKTHDYNEIIDIYDYQYIQYPLTRLYSIESDTATQNQLAAIRGKYDN